MELIVNVENVVLNILIQAWDGECPGSWISFRDLFREDTIRLYKFARFLEGGMGRSIQGSRKILVCSSDRSKRLEIGLLGKSALWFPGGWSSFSTGSLLTRSLLDAEELDSDEETACDRWPANWCKLYLWTMGTYGYCPISSFNVGWRFFRLDQVRSLKNSNV